MGNTTIFSDNYIVLCVASARVLALFTITNNTKMFKHEYE